MYTVNSVPTKCDIIMWALLSSFSKTIEQVSFKKYSYVFSDLKLELFFFRCNVLCLIKREESQHPQAFPDEISEIVNNIVFLEDYFPGCNVNLFFSFKYTTYFIVDED